MDSQKNFNSSQYFAILAPLGKTMSNDKYYNTRNRPLHALSLSVYRTSVRDLIKQAQDQLKKATKQIRQLKIVPMPRSVIPNVANHVAMAQASGKPMVLTRTTPAQAIVNRVAATELSPSAGIGRSLDEYPFASSIQGGFGSSVAPVPALENSIQGGIIGGCYTIERITPGTAYIVVVTP